MWLTNPIQHQVNGFDLALETTQIQFENMQRKSLHAEPAGDNFELH